MPSTPNRGQPPQPQRQSTFDKATQALDLISNGLQILDSLQSLDELEGPRSLDITARLNASYCALEKHLGPLKDHIKAEALQDGLTDKDEAVLRGRVYEAVVRRIGKVVLDTANLKKWLGKKLPQFQTKREDISVSFRVKA